MATVKNVYPSLPVVPYKRTTVSMDLVVKYISQRPVSTELKRAAYIVFRNESSNGKSGVLNNYIGLQADGNRWDNETNKRIIATTLTNENQTGHARRFAAFASWTDSVDILLDRLKARGLYVGGTVTKYAALHIQTPADLSVAYYKSWVTGNPKAMPPIAAVKNFLSMYKQATALF